MLIVGLTGGIGAGKSTVARMLGHHGAAIVDADRLAREIMEPGRGVLEAVVERFGRSVLRDDGRLDRAALAQIVFGDAHARRDLEQITHPAIAELSSERFAAARSAGHEICIYEAALLVEAGRHKQMDRLIVVVAEDELRVERVAARDGVEMADARRRLEAQMDQRAKAELADYVIDNSGSLQQTRQQVERVWREIEAEAKQR